MNDPDEFDPIAASLRRQFSPPSLTALEDRIAQAAQEQARDLVSEVLPRDADRRRGWAVGFAVAFAIAAAVVLVVLRPWASEAPDDAPVIAETPIPHDLLPPTSAQRAGFQLHAFLSRGDTLPTDAVDCKPPEPPEQCASEGGEPTLIEGGGVTQLGECGGSTGTDCADFGLPADRALLVSDVPTGTQAIVCIERAWTDPHPTLPPGSPYNLFRAELGEFILYEITPLDQPLALDVLRL